MRQPLIDADVLVYESGFAAESGWEGDGFPPFDYAATQLDTRIANICAMVDATHPPILFLTGKTNFRNAIAKRQKYKDRPSNKPHHYKNLIAYIKGKYDYRLTEGLEADDLMAIEQTLRPDETIICTRDKDLLATTGWHYCWELGKQASFGPEYVEGLGYIHYDPVKKKLRGVGELFFFSQCLMGDPVDSVPGLPKCGPKKAYDILFDCVCREDAYNRILVKYQEVFNEDAEDALLEQARLVHMTKRLVDNKILLWSPPTSNYEDWYDINTGRIERTS